MKKLRLIAIGVVAALGLAGCGGEQLATGTIAIEAHDFRFDGVPEQNLAVGASLTFANESESDEFHHMIVARLAPDETRPLSELLELPEDQLEALIEEMLDELSAYPGEAGTTEAGQSSVTVNTPGRYVMLCFIPQGTKGDPLRTWEDGGAQGPPPVGEGPPHVVFGMHTEFTVQDK